MNTDEGIACPAVEVKPLVVVLFACALLVGNGLFALLKLLDGLQGVVFAELGPAVVLGAVLAHEQAALLAVVSRLAFFIALMTYELSMSRGHVLRFDHLHQGIVDLQLRHRHGAHFTALRAGEPNRSCRCSRRSAPPRLCPAH